MGAPVLVDDGGSIRIKLAKEDPNTVGQMDGLFALNDVPGSGQKSSEQDINDPDDYNNVLVLWLDKGGGLHQQNYTPFKKVTITTDFKLSIEAKNLAGPAKLKLKITGDAPGPIVASKQHVKKRSYAILNAGRIEQIVVDNNIPINIANTDIYAAVVIT